MREVVHIAHHRPNSTNIILIDDANLFGVDPTYPTLEWALTHYSFKDHYTFVYHDIIHALPKALFR
jgi:hypothetical protein